MKGLSVRQPWASLIASGEKTIETRRWSTKHRGPLLIVSSQKPAGQGPTGVSLCLVNLLEVRPREAADERASLVKHPDGLLAWVLELVKVVPHFRVRGYQRIFEVREVALCDFCQELVHSLGQHAAGCSGRPR